jgi:thiol-disulfide isomerase/thioredoxin
MRIALYFCLISVGVFTLGCTGIFPKQEHISGAEKSVSGGVDFPVLLYSEDSGVDLAMFSNKSDELWFSDFFTQNKPVILHFWAGLCPFCREDIQTLQVIHEAYGNEIVVFGLDVGPLVGLGSVDDGKNLRNESNATYYMGTTSDMSVARAFRITGTPTTIVFDVEGQLIGVWNGMHSIQTAVDVMVMIDELLSVSIDQTS